MHVNFTPYMHVERLAIVHNMQAMYPSSSQCTDVVRLCPVTWSACASSDLAPLSFPGHLHIHRQEVGRAERLPPVEYQDRPCRVGWEAECLGYCEHVRSVGWDWVTFRDSPSASSLSKQ